MRQVFFSLILAMVWWSHSALACTQGVYLWEWKRSFWTKSDTEITSVAKNLAKNGQNEFFIPFENPLPQGLSTDQVKDKLKKFKNAFEAAGGGKANVFAFANPGTRSLSNPSSLDQYASNVWAVGFDGLHVDIEPVKPGDTRYVELLKSLYQNKPVGKKTSVASYMIVPSREDAMKLYNKKLLYWDEAYLKQMLPYLDHIVVMNYDSGLGGEEYATHTANQVKIHANLFHGRNKEWRLGLPAYKVGRHKSKFHPPEENMASALKGLSTVYPSAQCPRDFGLGTWLYQQIKPDEWSLLKDWQNKNNTEQGEGVTVKTH